MKKLLALFILFICSRSLNAQTVIPVTTTVYNFSSMKNGVYRIITAVDTLDVTKDTAAKVPRVCPVCPVCPPPVICPVCPPIPKQRTANGLVWSAAIQRWTILYDDGTQSNL